jgi:phosphate transport system substrate-binding protein
MNTQKLCCAFLLPLALFACSDKASHPERAVTDQTVLVNGSSTVYPLSKEAAQRFERSNAHAHIDVKFSGTTGGFRSFCKGETDISNSSRLINTEEKSLCESHAIRYLELPIAMDSIAVVVHPKNTWANDINVAELKKLWEPAAEGKIKTWKDVRSDWPDQPIVLFGRGQDSGTYDYFTTEIVGETRSSRKDYTGSEDEEFLAEKIAAEKNSLGFFGIGAYHRHWNEVKLIAVDGVYPTLDTVKNGSYKPLTRPLYLYVNEASMASKATVAPFLESYLSGLPSWIHFTGYMPIDSSLIAQGRKNIQQLSMNNASQ